MEKNKTLAIIITATVAVIMIGSLLVPIINDAIDGSKVYYNNSSGAYAQATGDDNLIITITMNIGEGASTVYTVGDRVLPVPVGSVLLLSENLTICQNYDYGISIEGVTSNGNQITPGNHASVSITINGSNISYTATMDDTTINGDTVNAWAFYRYDEGDYRLIDYLASAQTIYVNDFSQIYASNRIVTNGAFFSLNGLSVKTTHTVNGETTINDYTASVSSTDVMRNVKSFVVDPDRATSGAFKFTIEHNGEPYDVYPYYMVVPSMVYGQTESNEAYAGILAVLPVMVICGVIVATIAVFRTKY